MGLVASNPCDAVERPRTVVAPARGYSADEVKRLLAVIPDTVAGRRDRAIVLTLLLTGRRRAEVMSLQAKDLSVEGETAFYTYRGKGGKRGRRELPRPAFEAIARQPARRRQGLAEMGPDESLWQAAHATVGRREPHVLSPVPPLLAGCAGSRRPASTSRATPPPSSGATRASPSRR